MIVVVGNAHDSVAKDLVASWPNAALCSAEDLVYPGWVWRHTQPESRTWIVATRRVSDQNITGVFLRRSTVYPEELLTIHPADRAFLASEVHAFLTFVLATTAAQVVNPVIEGTFGEEALRPHRWADIASEVGISVRLHRVSSEPLRRSRYRTSEVEVVGNEVFGDVPRKLLGSVRQLAQALGIKWGVFVFDARQRLVTVTVARRPSAAATAALADFLKSGRT